jgi:hypothetical protein
LDGDIYSSRKGGGISPPRKREKRKMEKAIEILQEESRKVSDEYSAKCYEIHLARQFGKKSELVSLRKEESDLWIRLATHIDLIAKLQEERVEA